METLWKLWPDTLLEKQVPIDKKLTHIRRENIFVLNLELLRERSLPTPDFKKQCDLEEKVDGGKEIKMAHKVNDAEE